MKARPGLAPPDQAPPGQTSPSQAPPGLLLMRRNKPMEAFVPEIYEKET